MVLPGSRKDSISILHWIREHLPEEGFLLSLLSQYTPFYKSCEYPQINRRLTTYEYDKVLEEAISLGLTKGFMQEKSSAKRNIPLPLIWKDCKKEQPLKFSEKSFDFPASEAVLFSITFIYCSLQWNRNLVSEQLRLPVRRRCPAEQINQELSWHLQIH